MRTIRGRRGPSEGGEDHQREKRTIRGRRGPSEGEEDHQRQTRTIRERRTVRGTGGPSEGEEDHQRERDKDQQRELGIGRCQGDSGSMDCRGCIGGRRALQASLASTHRLQTTSQALALGLLLRPWPLPCFHLIGDDGEPRWQSCRKDCASIGGEAKGKRCVSRPF